MSPTLKIAALCACAGLSALPAAAQTSVPGPVLPGIEVFLESPPASLVGKRLGLITNQTGIDRQRRTDIDLLLASPHVKLVALFAAEHGIRGDVPGGNDIAFETDPSGLPVHSIYGKTNKPTQEMLEGLDALLYDMQDLGVRQYTTGSTMLLAMQACQEKGIPFVVLDRPNPVTGEIVEGNVLEPGFENFIGIGPVASRHGLTMGELAKFYNAELKVGSELIVVPARGWKRSMWLADTGLPWVKTSPNIYREETAVHYPGTVYFEATNVAESRGSDMPFEQVGAPWMKASDVVAAMNAMNLPGVRFEARDYPIAEGYRKYPGQTVHGVRLVVTDRESYRPLRASLLLMDVIRKLHPADFKFSSAEFDRGTGYSIERHAGTTKLVAAFESGTLSALLDDWDRQARAFAEKIKPYLLYE
ncbi:MAG: exo-beta-N-acetylmuramidase NamZ family protein [Longimicrobiales bacterium]